MLEQIIEMMTAHHKPELRHEEGKVIELWNDGEITSTKSGSLYGQRNEHMILHPFLQDKYADHFREAMLDAGFESRERVERLGIERIGIAVTDKNVAKKIASEMNEYQYQLVKFYMAQP